MKRDVETRIVLTVFLMVSVLLATTVHAGNEAGAGAPSGITFTGTGHALPVDIVDARIGIYEKMAADPSLPAPRREAAESLLDDYRKIKTALEGEICETYYREITHILFDGVRRLEETYLKGAPAADQPQVQGAPAGEPPVPAETDTPGPAIPPPMMDSMVTGIEGLLAGDTLSGSDRETAAALLEYYRKLQAALAADVSEEYYREITHQLFDGMLLLENGFVVTDQASSPEAEVLAVEKNWIRAFNTLDFDLMASLYRHDPQTTSYSPNSASLYQGWDTIAEGLRSYFAAPQGTYTWRLDGEQITLLSDDMAIILGTHVVVDRPADGQQMTGTHVFTRVVQKIEGQWRIVHEHESHIPRRQS